MNPSCETWTPAEQLALQVQFGFNTVLAYQQISCTQLSLGRFGGCNVNGHRFDYLPHTDELVRADAVKFLRRLRAAEAKAARLTQAQAAQAAQPELI